MAYEPSPDDDDVDTGFKHVQTTLHQNAPKPHPEDLYEPASLGPPNDE